MSPLSLGLSATVDVTDRVLNLVIPRLLTPTVIGPVTYVLVEVPVLPVRLLATVGLAIPPPRAITRVARPLKDLSMPPVLPMTLAILTLAFRRFGAILKVALLVPSRSDGPAVDMDRIFNTLFIARVSI